MMIYPKRFYFAYNDTDTNVAEKSALSTESVGT